MERAGAGAGLALDDHEALDAGTREVVRNLAAKRCEVYVRRWDRFGTVDAVRDAVLCAPPPSAAGAHAVRAPPSAEAVERILQVGPSARRAALG
jgi:hypothetical protein